MENDQITDRIMVQQVEVEFEKPDNAFKIRDELSKVCRKRLIPAIQQLFQEKYAGGPLLGISRLVIDAGRVDPENWESDFVNAVILRLEQYLDAEEAGRRLQEEIPGKRNLVNQDHERRVSSILYYLKNGVLPWNSPLERNAALRKELLQLLKSSGRQAFGNKKAGRRRNFNRELLRLLEGNFNAMKRFLYLVPEKNILPILIKREWDRSELRKMRKNWNAIFGLAGLPEDDCDAVFLQALLMLHGKIADHGQSFPDALSQEIVRILEQWYKPVFQKLPEVLENYLFLLPAKQAIGRRQGRSIAPVPEAPCVRLTEEPLYIGNAGLVLLHPFLHHLFENIGHTVKYQWDSADLQLRSLVLTQYLVNGQDDYAEPDLWLNKVMVGFPVATPLPLEITLSDFEKNEARELLESVIKHWKPLTNTGVAALRESFLMRPGKIVHRQNGWLLEVGQRIPDVLLVKIPWGFSAIKTPWMKQVLNVEWAGNEDLG